jgi:two-component system, chemotaxis family, protein-glutamate methylesterase/glutaminase
VKVMIVDDSSMMRGVLRTIVEQAPQMQVVAEAADGVQALACLARDPVDLILLDIEMPNMDGLSFLKASRLLTIAPVIVVSSVVYPMSSVLTTAISLGATDVVPKPSGVLSLDMVASRGAALLDALQQAASLVWQTPAASDKGEADE